MPAVVPSLFAGVVISGKHIGESLGWEITAIIMCVLSLMFGIFTVKSLKGVKLIKAEAENVTGERKKIKAIFAEMLEVLKIKPFKWFAMFIVFFLIASSMIQSSFEYMIKDCVGADPEIYMVVVIVELVVVMAAFIPIVTKVAEKKDRRFSSLVFMSIMCVGLIGCKIAGVKSIAVVLIITFFMAVGMANFWTVFYSIAYDLVEVDEFAYGSRRESVITALPQFFQKFGSAIGVWTVGFVLQLAGYNKANSVQPATVAKGIENNVTILPAAFLVLSIIGVYLYPVTKDKFSKLKDDLEKKKAGQEYSTDGLEKLV